MPKPIAVIQMGLPPEPLRARLGDQADWFAAALGQKRPDLLVVQPFLGDALPGPERFALAIVTGSWAMVTDREGWSERTAAWLKRLIPGGTPVLGVCYGHQLMAHALGGVVDYLPGGREQGTFAVTLSEAGVRDPLLHGLPRTFAAQLSHSQSVLRPPAGAEVLAATARDANAALRYGPNAVSVQFHPEFTPAIIEAILASRRHGAVPERAPETPDARSVLLRFVAAARAGAAIPAVSPATRAAAPLS